MNSLLQLTRLPKRTRHRLDGRPLAAYAWAKGPLGQFILERVLLEHPKIHTDKARNPAPATETDGEGWDRGRTVEIPKLEPAVGRCHFVDGD